MGIRFIDLSEQLGCFAFYQTTVDRFLEYSDQQTWTSWASFERSWQDDPYTMPSNSVEYLKAYCPDWIFEKGQNPSFAANALARAVKAVDLMIEEDNSEPSKDQISKRQLDKEMRRHNMHIDERHGR